MRTVDGVLRLPLRPERIGLGQLACRIQPRRLFGGGGAALQRKVSLRPCSELQHGTQIVAVVIEGDVCGAVEPECDRSHDQLPAIAAPAYARPRLAVVEACTQCEAQADRAGQTPHAAYETAAPRAPG